MRGVLYVFLCMALNLGLPAWAETVELKDGRTIELNADGTFDVKDVAQSGEVSMPSVSELMAQADALSFEEFKKKYAAAAKVLKEDERKALENRIFGKVKTVPGDDRAQNAAGYSLLIDISPENPAYKEKFEIYSSVPALHIGDVARNLNDNRTRVQRDAFWEKIDGSRVSVTGKVTDVRPAGLFSNGSVDLQAAKGVTVKCDLTEESAKIMAEIEKGQQVKCEGTAFSYNIVFGELHLTVSDSLVVER